MDGERRAYGLAGCTFLMKAGMAVRRSPFSVQRSAFTVQRSAGSVFGVWGSEGAVTI
jgi:hypothetical protein